MWTSCRSAWLALALIVAFPGAVMSSELRLEAFEWFDSLGLVDIEQTQCVRITFGPPAAADVDIHSDRVGFLLADEQDQFTVLLLDLTRASFSKQPRDENQPDLHYGYTVVDPHDVAQQWSNFLEEHEANIGGSWSRLFGRMTLRGELFLLARACAAAGHDKTAATLCEWIEQHSLSEAEFQPTLVADIAHSCMWHAVLDFGNPAITRPQLLTKLRWFVGQFAENKHASRAREMAELLETMIAEDEAHAATAPPLEELMGEERIAELIFLLRDQRGHQFGFHFDESLGEDNPGLQLVNLGYDAVPQLIEVLDDQRFTRSITCHRDIYFSHEVWRIGDAALAALHTIAGFDFFRPYMREDYPSDDRILEIQKAARAWWAEFQKKGERQTLIESVSSGGNAAESHARMLIEKHPDAALPAIEQGLANAKYAWTRTELVVLAGGLDGEAVLPLLYRELLKGSELSTRLAAAWALRRRGESEQSVDAMIVEWRNYTEPDRMDVTRTGEALITFLASSGEVRAIEALAAGLDKRHFDSRIDTVKSLGGWCISSLSAHRLGAVPDTLCGRPNQEVSAAIEDLLATALADTGRSAGRRSMTWKGVDFKDPRICDLAAFVLSQRWPDRYQFDPNATEQQRERRRLEMITAWREARGKGPIKVPEK